MACFLGQESGEILDHGGIEALDGDIARIRPADVTPDDGIRIKSSCSNQGRPLETAFMPTRMRVAGPKRRLTDVLPGYMSLLVPARFRALLEELEPVLHQFFPIILEWSDGSPAGDRFWFNVCNRIDGVSPEGTTFEFRNIWFLDGSPDKTLVFSRQRIGARHAWAEKLISGFNRPFISDVFAERLQEAGLSGMKLQRFDEVE
ncbi:DUF1629 domain-containing protein [Oricola sp.]|uniref:imm11 family protein n=1 Tax=Oricola sp. TaxID=1979950 RepID=UPI0025E4C94F|nr:DUF1629 domain-containing protein [Oricola sp.]MCI5075208.1 hypothetical protein [Oricola sp.]